MDTKQLDIVRSGVACVLLVWLLAAALGPSAAAAPLQNATDTTEAPPADTLRDAEMPSDAMPGAEEEGAVHFTAQDSLIITFDEEGGDKSRLVGEARVASGEATLEAHSIDLLFEKNELYARGPEEATGNAQGTPRFQEGGSNETFTGQELAYNLSTERGRVVRALTEIQDGFIRAGLAKKSEQATYIQGGQYTTCDCEPDETPSYTLRSDRMKLVDEEWVYTGPIQLFIFNIPTPLWLPFAFLPTTEGRRSGPIAPEYGEDERGFYLRNLGWYFAMNDYMDFEVRGGIWSRGSWEIRPQFRYNLRDRYNGSLSLDYQNLRRGEFYDPNYSIRQSASLRWNHSQDVNPFTSFSASVDLTTPLYLQTASEDYNDRVRQTANSSIQYSTRWPTVGRRLSVSMNHRETFTTGEANLTVPSIDFRQSQLRPFERSRRGPGESERWYERITTSYSGSLKNQYSFDPLSDEELRERGDTTETGEVVPPDVSWYEGMLYPSRYRQATGEEIPFEMQASHDIPVSMNFSLSRLPLLGTPMQLNLSPSFNYSEDWFVSTERQRYDEERGRVVREDVSGFFAHREFNTGVSANTRFYGIFPLRIGSYDGLRHTVRPNLSFNYRPDFYGEAWGYTRTYQDAEGEEQRYPIVRGISEGRQQSVSLSLGNVFEARHVTEVDTTGERETDIVQLLNLDLSTSYNFAAEEFPLSDINLRARTRVFDNLNLNANSTFSPYRLDAEGERRIDEYVFSPQNLRFARMTNFRVNASFSLQSSQQSTDQQQTGAPTGQQQPPDSGVPQDDPAFMDDPSMQPTGNVRADFSIPWSMNVDMSYSVNRPNANTTNRRATVNANFEFNLTPRWRVRGRTGYDFIDGEFVTSEFNIFRDLDCWEMSFRWIPFGSHQSYGFTLQVKSGQLRDLLRLQEPQRDFGGRFEQAARSRL